MPMATAPRVLVQSRRVWSALEASPFLRHEGNRGPRTCVMECAAVCLAHAPSSACCAGRARDDSQSAARASRADDWELLRGRRHGPSLACLSTRGLRAVPPVTRFSVRRLRPSPMGPASPRLSSPLICGAVPDRGASFLRCECHSLRAPAPAYLHLLLALHLHSARPGLLTRAGFPWRPLERPATPARRAASCRARACACASGGHCSDRPAAAGGLPHCLLHRRRHGRATQQPAAEPPSAAAAQHRPERRRSSVPRVWRGHAVLRSLSPGLLCDAGATASPGGPGH